MCLPGESLSDGFFGRFARARAAKIDKSRNKLETVGWWWWSEGASEIDGGVYPQEITRLLVCLGGRYGEKEGPENC